mgnify:CR=1 FL=1
MEFNSSATDDNNEERGFFKVGDSLVVKFTTIDKESYEFLNLFEIEVANNGNPFASPSTLNTNVSNGGLGFFVGYGVTYDTLSAK